MLCVECGHSVSHLYREYSKNNIRLAHCPNCKEFCDKYIECEPNLVFIDLILHKVQAYRHMLFNRIIRGRDIYKFLIVIFAFDSFDRWYCLFESNNSAINQTTHSVWPAYDKNSRINMSQFALWLKPHAAQWLIPSTAITGTCIFLLFVCLFTQVAINLQGQKQTVDFKFLLSSLILSCFSKLGILLWMVWEAEALHRKTISLFTLTSNVLAVKVFLKTSSWISPLLIVGLSFTLKTVITNWIAQSPTECFKFSL
jgi:lipid intermediate transporter